MVNYKFREALTMVGSEHKYQYLLSLFCLFGYIVVTYIMLAPTYLYAFPEFACDGMKQSQNEDYACSHLDYCRVKNIYSLTYRLDLICNKAYIRNLIISLLMVGTILGTIVMGYVADKYGRKPATFICNLSLLISLACTYLGGHFKYIWPLMLGQIFRGFGVYALQSCLNFMIYESLSEKLYNRVIVLLYAAWGFTQMTLYPILLIIPEWNKLMLYCHMIPLTLLIVLSWFVKQSPQYLLNKSSDKCRTCLNEIAKINKFTLLPLQITISKDDQQAVIQAQYSYFDLFKSRSTLKGIILLGIIGVIMDSVYEGTSYSLSLLEFDYKTNFLIIGFIEFIAYFLLSFFASRLKRKKTLIITTLITLPMLISYQFFHFTDSNYTILALTQSILAGCIRLASTISYTMISFLAIETFEAQYRVSACNLIYALSVFSNLVPFGISLSLKLKINQMCFLGILLTVSLLAMFQLKQTSSVQAVEKQQSIVTTTTEAKLQNPLNELLVN